MLAATLGTSKRENRLVCLTTLLYIAVKIGIASAVSTRVPVRANGYGQDFLCGLAGGRPGDAENATTGVV